MKTKRSILLIVAGCTLLLGGCGLVIGLVVAPALARSGLGQAFGAALQLSQALNASGLVDGANVKVGSTVSQGRTIRTLTVDCRWLGSEPADERAATQVAGLVLDHYDRIAEVDVLTIAFSQRAQVGPVNLRQSQTYSHPLSDWRGRLQRRPA